MNLIAPGLLWFGLFSAVPLIIHLYHRRKRVITYFSTNRFFTEAVSQSQRRMQLQRVWLMLLRIALCLLLAAAVARPYFRTAGAGGSAGRRDVVLLVDDTLSMRASSSATGQGSGTGFERARTIATSLLEKLHARDRAAVLTCSGTAPGESGAGAAVRLTTDKGALIRAVRELKPSSGAGDPFSALYRVSEVLRSTRSRAPVLIVLTDMQRGQWPESTWPQPASPVPTTLVQVTAPPEDNVWIEEARLSPAALLPGRPAALEVRLRNSAVFSQSAKLRVRINDRLFARHVVDVEARGRRTEQIVLRMGGGEEEDAGDASAPIAGGAGNRVRLQVQADVRDDPLQEDNTFYLAGLTVPRLSVLIVDGQTARSVRRRSAFYLGTALHSLGEGAAMEVSHLPVGQVPWGELDTHRVVVLSGVPELPDNAVEALEGYVRAGGGLLIFLGEPLNRDFYNSRLTPRVDGGLLPGPLLDLVVAPREADPMHVRKAEWDHDIFRRYRGELRPALAAISVRRAWQLAPEDGWVLARLDRDIPFLVERRLGDGVILTAATMPEPDWTELPLRRNFVGLVNRWIDYLAAGRQEGRGSSVGRELELPREAAENVSSPKAIRPDGQLLPSRERSVGAKTVQCIGQEWIDQPGFYHGEEDRTPQWLLAVNCPRSESVPGLADMEKLGSFSGDWELSLVDLRGEGGPADEGDMLSRVLGAGTMNRGLWDVMLWIALAVLAAEPVLANRASGGRKKSGEGQPPRETQT